MNKRISSEEVETKLTQLEIYAKQTEQLLQIGTLEAVDRHLGGPRSTINKANHLKHELEAQKIEVKQALSDIDVWNEEVNQKITKAEEKLSLLRQWLENRKREDEMDKREGRLKFEMELHEKKLKMQADLKVSQETTPTTSTPSKQATAKLLKISIGKFEGCF